MLYGAALLQACMWGLHLLRQWDFPYRVARYADLGPLDLGVFRMVFEGLLNQTLLNQTLLNRGLLNQALLSQALLRQALLNRALLCLSPWHGFTSCFPSIACASLY